MKRSVVNILSYSSILMAFIALIYVAYLLFVPPQINIANIQPYRILNPQVHAGEVVYYQANLCKFADVSATINRRLAGSYSYNLPDTISNIKSGCRIINVGVVVPEHVLPGRYSLELDLQYKVNFLRTASYNYTTEQFEVLPRKQNQ